MGEPWVEQELPPGCQRVCACGVVLVEVGWHCPLTWSWWLQRSGVRSPCPLQLLPPTLHQPVFFWGGLASPWAPVEMQRGLLFFPQHFV